MTLQARIIGPESDLGHVSTLTYFGNEIGRDWSDVKLTAEQVRKAEGNAYIDLKGQKADRTPEDDRKDADDQVEEDLIRERLAELKVEASPKAKLPALRTKLEDAEKAEAKRLEDLAAAAEDAAQD